MATKKPAAWSTETISEFKVEGTAAVWRSQISTAPDGKRFAGIRKYFIKKDGTERADRAGFSVLIDEENPSDTSEALEKLGELVTGLASAFEGPKLKKVSKRAKDNIASLGPLSAAIKQAAADKRGSASSPKAGKSAVLMKMFGRKKSFLMTWEKDPSTAEVEVKTTSDITEARMWPSAAQAEAWMSKRPKSLAGYSVHQP